MTDNFDDGGKKDSKEDLAVKAGLLMVKKQMEEKSGIAPHNKEKKSLNQDELLKKIRDKKKKTKELSVDAFVLKRSYFYTENVDPYDVIEYVKEKLWDSPKDISLINILGVAYMMTGDYHKSEFEFKKGINIDTGNIDINYNFAELYIRKGNTKDALDYLTVVLKRDKDELNALYLMGLVFYLKGNSAQAVNIIAQGLKLDKEFQRVHKNFAFLSLIKRNVDKTEEIIKKLTERDVKNISGHIVFENILLMKNKIDEYQSDEKIMENIVRSQESVYSPCISVNKGILEMKNGNYDDAEEYFRSAVQANNRCICGIIQKGRLAFERKKYSESNEAVKKALYLNHDSIAAWAEVLKISYYMELENDLDDMVAKILSKEPTAVLKIVSEDKVLYKIELEKIKDKFYRSLKALLGKFNNENVYFVLEEEEELIIYKLFREMRICETVCNGSKEG